MGRASFRIGIDVGGWGLPFQRSIMRVEEDLARDLITLMPPPVSRRSVPAIPHSAIRIRH
jgi:hypothetical protein